MYLTQYKARRAKQIAFLRLPWAQEASGSIRAPRPIHTANRYHLFYRRLAMLVNDISRGFLPGRQEDFSPIQFPCVAPLRASELLFRRGIEWSPIVPG